MSRLRAAIAATTVTLVLATWTAAQVRDPDRAAGAAAMARITGHVEIEVNGQRAPVRRATVTLKSEANGQTWTTASDVDGRYQFDDVTAGTYRVAAAKTGFVSAAAERSIGVPAAGAVTVGLNLQRAGALEGRFLDDRGDPIARLTVIADRMPDTRENASTAGYSAVTDDLGRFRVHTLPPGRYRLHATPPPPASGDTVFYPGTSDQRESRIIIVASGETRDGLDFTVAAAPLSAIAAEALAAVDRDVANTPEVPGFTARIAGRITRADTGQPLANVTTQIASMPGADLSIVRVVRTNAEGRFEFTRLASGGYAVTATARGFIRADSGFTGPVANRRVVFVKDGERNERADVKLLPSSAIEVRLLDEFGDPAPNIVVQIAQPVDLPGVPRFMPGRGAEATTGPTDDRGWFRAYGLFPGDYHLVALPQPFAPSGQTGFATTFFPGTASADAAGAVHLVPGLDAHDVTFSLVAARTAAISGTTVDAAGRPVPQAQLVLLPTEHGEMRTLVMARATGEAGGSFRYRDVPEGTYVVQAMAPGLFGSAPVTVSAAPGRETDAVALTLRPPATARGRVVFEGDAARPKPGSVTVWFQPTDMTSGPVAARTPITSIAADWSFEIRDMAWQGQLAAFAPEGWGLARVMLNGRDITDVPYDFQLADVNGLEVVLTSRLGGISGSVLGSGQPVANATVVVFWAGGDGLAALSRISVAQTNAQGTFSVNGLVPGRYLALALRETAQPPANEASVLALRLLGTPVFVSEGANTTVALTVVK